jgi:hypothetical protein
MSFFLHWFVCMARRMLLFLLLRVRFAKCEKPCCADSLCFLSLRACVLFDRRHWKTFWLPVRSPFRSPLRLELAHSPRMPSQIISCGTNSRATILSSGAVDWSSLRRCSGTQTSVFTSKPLASCSSFARASAHEACVRRLPGLCVGALPKRRNTDQRFRAVALGTQCMPIFSWPVLWLRCFFQTPLHPGPLLLLQW